VDLNSDVGESFGNWSLGDDAAIFESVSSANVACGFHAGDPTTIRATCAAAAARGVVVGAHVGYRDLPGFGRRFIDIAPSDLTNDVVYQIGALQALARAAGTSVRYVKPHGALYNAIVHHAAQAQAVVDAILEVDVGLPLLVLALSSGSEIQRRAEAAGLRTVAEAFADRAYAPDGTLVPRTQPGALLDPDAVAEQVRRIACDRQLRSLDGTVIDLRADSICVHGDSPAAVRNASAARRALHDAGVSVESFA
jgi:5-oxoprolinase (ATP-hydrolysing) subunit A